MKKTLIAICLATLSIVVLAVCFLPGCRRDVEPIDDPVYDDSQQKVIVLHFLDEQGNSLSSVSVGLKKDGQALENFTKDGSITYPVSEEGTYTFALSKEGYVGCEHT